MSLHTFWIFILKAIGLYFLVEAITLLPQSILILYTNSLFENQILAISVVLLTVLAFYLLIKFLIFNPGIIIEKLKLDRGYQQENINMELNSKQLIHVCVIIFGAIQLINGFPELCREIYYYVQSKETLISDPSTEHILVNGIQVLFAYLIISRSKDITDFINNKSKSNSESKIEDENQN
jgi:hypothetical protein